MYRKNQNHALIPACRVFFDEFLKSDLFVHEHGMTFLVTPTGARCARLYGVGELKGVAQRGKIVRVTVNDSTASLNIYTNKDAQLGTIRNAGAAEKRTFIAFSGTVHQREGAGKRKHAIILAEEIGRVAESVRNSWILSTAWRTLERIERLRINLSFKPLQGLRVSPSGKPFQGFRGRGRSPRCGGTGGARDGAEPHIKKDLSKKQDSMLLDTAILKETLEHYALADDKLDALASTAINAVKSLWQQYRETTRGLIGEMVKKAGKSGMEREKIMSTLKTKGLPEEWIEDMIDELIIEGQCYESVSGVLTC